MYRKGRKAGVLRRLGKMLEQDKCCLSMSEFETVFQREKALADRGQRFFALVVFVPQGDVASSLQGLAGILSERLRTADTAGLLDTGHLAVMLPDTGEEGAFAMANAVMSQVASAGLKFDFRVYVYPGQGDKPGKGDKPGEGESRRAQDRPSKKEPDKQNLRSGTHKDLGLPSTDQIAAVHESSVLPTHSNSMELTDLGAVRTAISRSTPQSLHEFFHQPISFRKRALDVVVAGGLLFVLSPLLALVALAVKLTSPGPALFTQKRAGQGGVPFDFHKFRSMYANADEQKADLEEHNEKAGPIFKMKNDPRMTAIGRLLRKTSIDELPQLYNVLIGDMTLVGPRPPTMDEIEDYEPWQLARLNLRGGLTCIWQVSGRSEIGFTDWVRMDLRYAKKRGLGLDLSLLARTANAVVSRRGAY